MVEIDDDRGFGLRQSRRAERLGVKRIADHALDSPRAPAGRGCGIGIKRDHRASSRHQPLGQGRGEAAAPDNQDVPAFARRRPPGDQREHQRREHRGQQRHQQERAVQPAVDQTEIGSDRPGGQNERQVGAEQRTAGETGPQSPGRRQSDDRWRDFRDERDDQESRNQNQRVDGVEDCAQIERGAGVNEEDGHEEAVGRARPACAAAMNRAAARPRSRPGRP